MIVNTAYPFMIAKKPAANPNLFENGVSNYQTAFTNASLDASGLLLQNNGKASFYNIPLSKFSILNFSGVGGGFSKGRVWIAILDTNGAQIYKSGYFELNSSSSGASNLTFTIPEQHRQDGYGIQFITTNTRATIYSASLSV